jgi:hypothetical protein
MFTRLGLGKVGKVIGWGVILAISSETKLNILCEGLDVHPWDTLLSYSHALDWIR